MRSRTLIPVLAVILTATPALADQIYRWVDSSGQVHYSDVPRDGAEQVDIAPTQTFAAPKRVARSSSSPASADATDEPAGYDAFVIVSPSQEETIWNTGGAMTVAVNASPALQQGHSVSIYLDGSPVSKAPRATQTQLSEVVRGEHRITAEIRDASDRVIKTAEPVTFFYQQTSSGSRVVPPATGRPPERPRPRLGVR